MKDTVQTIRRSAHRFFSGTLLSRFSGMLRDMSMAYVFGTKPSIAAFMVAFRFAHLLRRLFGEGALQSAFIPEFEALRHQNEERAFHFFRSLSLLLTFFLLLLIGLSIGLLACLLAFGNLSPGNEEVIFLTLLMFPSLLFICLFGLNASLLQCQKSYFIPSVAPVAFNGIWILSVFYLKNMPAEKAMPWLAVGVVVACLFQWLMTVPQLLKSLKPAAIRFSLTRTWDDLRKLGKPLFLGIVGVAATQVNSAVDSLFARFAEPEGPALLWYAIRIEQLPLALFGIAIAGALLPPLSRALKGNRLDEYHHFLHDAITRTWIFMLPITAMIFLMGDISVHFIYGRGDFGAESAIQTTYCLWGYAIGLLPAALVLVLAPACYAQSNYFLPALASFGSVLLNMLLNGLFIAGFGWGAVSVAVATSISAWVNLFILGWKLNRSGITLVSSQLVQRGLATTFATAIAFYGSYQFRISFQQLPLFSNYLLFSTSFGYQLIVLGSQFVIFCAIFLISFFIPNLSKKAINVLVKYR